MASNDVPKTPGWRDLLALGVVGFSVTAVAVLAAVVLLRSSNPENSAQLILTAVLPLFGSWVGTVLAFYFSRENFESASRHTADLVQRFGPDERLRAISVKSVMRPLDQAKTFTLSKAEDQVLLQADIIAAMGDLKRLPVLDPQGRPKYMIHRSTLTDFILAQVSAGKDATKLTLKNLLDDKDANAAVTQGFKTLAPTATLADAKAFIDQYRLCLDVFITDDGTPNTRMIGWLTNNAILEQSRA
jgi:hypothetical protein